MLADLDIPATLWAAAGLLIVVAVIIALLGRRALDARLGPLKVEVGQINKAVNHVQPGDPTLIQRVCALEAGQQWQADALHAIARQVGSQLPPHPKETP